MILVSAQTNLADGVALDDAHRDPLLGKLLNAYGPVDAVEPDRWTIAAQAEQLLRAFEVSAAQPVDAVALLK